MDSNDEPGFRVVRKYLYSGLQRVSNIYEFKHPIKRDRKAKTVTLQEKWEKVKEFYEGAYHVKFSKPLSPKQVEFLYSEMRKLKESLELHYEQTRRSLYRF